MDAQNPHAKSKTITTIDVNILPAKPEDHWLEASLADHLQCVLCGTDLEFQHKTNFIDHHVVEEAHCPHCHIRTRQTDYRLQ